MSNMDEGIKNLPSVTTGVRSSFDIPPERHDVSEDEQFQQKAWNEHYKSTSTNLEDRVRVLEGLVSMLCDKLLDKPIDLQSAE